MPSSTNKHRVVRGIAVFLALMALLNVGCIVVFSAVGDALGMTDDLGRGMGLGAAFLGFCSLLLFLADHRRHRPDPPIPLASASKGD